MRGALDTPHLHVCGTCLHLRTCRSPRCEGKVIKLCHGCIAKMIARYVRKHRTERGLMTEN